MKRSAPSRTGRARRRHLFSGFERLEPKSLLSTFTVRNTNDSGLDSLRQALFDARNDSNPDADLITFDIPTSDPNFDRSPTPGPFGCSARSRSTRAMAETALRWTSTQPLSRASERSSAP